ncbi:hypothetical protein PCI56_01090 [Plesiomonas shigelloides subsp. oncorhynchi]|nr:hypothetical protein [Plesiomonas shigelloides]
MDPLYKTLLDKYSTEAGIAKAFGVARAVSWRDKVPEKIALLCHLSPDINYTYNPHDYGREIEQLNLGLNELKKAS